MNLRRQLLLVSLLTLILPWAGCQFIRETESALREGQQQMLGGTARAIADSLSQFPYEFLAEETGAARIYAHPLANAPLVDGYVDDWNLPDGAFVSLRGKDGAIRYVAGVYRQNWYFFLDVRDASVVFRDAQAGAARAFDYAVLTSVDEQGTRVAYQFAAEAPGPIVATRHTRDGVSDEPRIAAEWRNTAYGYQLEIRVPRSLVAPRLGLSVSNTDGLSGPAVISSSFGDALPGPVVTVSPVLQSVAAGYAQDGMRLIIVDRDGWRLAEAGSITQSGGGGSSQPPSGWLRLIYTLLLEPGAEAQLAEPAANGREQQSYVAEALAGTPASRWFRSPDTGRAVISVAEPIWSGTVQTGAIVLQQGTDAILSLTNEALARLIVLTLITVAVVAGVLIGYASWLSLRIRNLSTAAVLALEDKRLNAALPSALAGDEVGDLSRSFSSVLRQLGVYNEYLRSLANKLSHELRTPLTIVRSSLENLEHESLSDDATEYTARAKEGTDRLQSILNAMSEANRTEELVENIEPEAFELSTVVQSTLAAYADAWPGREFRFDNRTAAAIVNGAPELLIQMLDKLVDNAVDFTTDGDRIDISLEPAGDSVLLSVSNPGPRLPEDMQAELFRSMVSLRSGEGGKHLGLGLYIAKLIAEGHEGSINAVNTDDGVCFQVRLPANSSA